MSSMSAVCAVGLITGLLEVLSDTAGLCAAFLAVGLRVSESRLPQRRHSVSLPGSPGGLGCIRGRARRGHPAWPSLGAAEPPPTPPPLSSASYARVHTRPPHKGNTVRLPRNKSRPEIIDQTQNLVLDERESPPELRDSLQTHTRTKGIKEDKYCDG